MMSDSSQALQRRAARIYLLLLVLTTITLGVGHAGSGDLWVSLAVLGLALLKGQLVGDHFMGLKDVRGPWRWAILFWLLLVGALITTAFVLGR